MEKTILVVDDDRDIVRLISDGLKYEQFKIVSAYSGIEALEKVCNEKIDFIILDIMMPGMDGLEVCRMIRQKYNLPILILSAKDRDMDKVIGLEIGADDYMTKPFSIHELTSRVRAHFRKVDRLQKEWTHQFEDGQFHPQPKSPLFLNQKSFEAYLNNQKIELSTKEFQILSYLYQHTNQVLSREQIYEKIWGDEFGDINTVTVHIKNLRKKLGKNFDYIKTIWGIGYKFVLEGSIE